MRPTSAHFSSSSSPYYCCCCRCCFRRGEESIRGPSPAGSPQSQHQANQDGGSMSCGLSVHGRNRQQQEARLAHALQGGFAFGKTVCVPFSAPREKTSGKTDRRSVPQAGYRTSPVRLFRGQPVRPFEATGRPVLRNEEHQSRQRVVQTLHKIEKRLFQEMAVSATSCWGLSGKGNSSPLGPPLLGSWARTGGCLHLSVLDTWFPRMCDNVSLRAQACPSCDSLGKSDARRSNKMRNH